jgi:hypothetical protein
MAGAGTVTARVYHSIERLREGRAIGQCMDEDVFEVVRILAVEEVLSGPGTLTERVYTVLAARDAETHRAPRKDTT